MEKKVSDFNPELDGQPSEEKQKIVRQFYLQVLQFAKAEMKFKVDKMSCFFEIMHYVFQKLLNERLSEDQNFEIYKELLLRHSV
jgi:hypothetical protein